MMKNKVIVPSEEKSKQPKPQLREKVTMHGAQSLSDKELIAVLLGSGTKECPVLNLADEVLQSLDSPQKHTQEIQFELIRGIGEGKSALIKAALELGRRFYGTHSTPVTCALDFIPLVRHYCDRNREHFLCASLNGANEVIDINVVSIGTVNKTIVHPREVFSEAINKHATSIIVCHNHPSGKLEASVHDIAITDKLQEASSIIGIALLDHIIITPNSFLSFKEEGLLREMP